MARNSDVRDIFREGPLTSYHEGLILGNGDLGAVVHGNSWELKLALGKNDVWDARFESDPEADILKHDDLIELIEEYGVESFRGMQSGEAGPNLPMWMLNPVGEKAVPSSMRTIYATPSAYAKGRYCRPCPKRVGEIVFVGPGLSSTPMRSRLWVEQGIFEVEFSYRADATIRLEGFIWAEGNVLCLRVQVDGDLRRGNWAKLIMRKWPDAVDDSIPDPVLEYPFGGKVVALTQEIPGDEEIEPFAWTLAGVLPGSRIDQRYETIVSLPGESATADHFFAVATTRDSRDSKRAIEMAIQAQTQGYDLLKESQVAWWTGFWNRSSVELEDEELEAAWYRDQYSLACNLREGVQAPGLYGNMTMWDAAMWHGDYHMDKNFQKNFYPVLVTNHCEMSEPYFRAIQDYMPSAEWRARHDFGLEGAYVDLVLYPYQPGHRMFICNTMGKQLGMGGWALGQYWQYWQYTKDEQWLGETGYPVMKKVAEFYWNYLEKYQEKSGGDIYPSACQESLPLFRNVFQDLLFFRFAFRVAARCAEVLGVDAEWQARWHEGLERVPPYRIIEHDGCRRIADHKEATGAGPHSRNSFIYGGYIAGPLIFPGEDVDPESDSELAQVIREGLETFREEEAFTHNFLSYSLDVPAARLKMDRAYAMVRHAVTACRFPGGTAAMFNNMETGMNSLQMYPYGLQVEDFTMPFAITELLLQSYGEVIRLFPAWPTDKSARFESLRAEGAFLVSSSLEGGEIGLTRIHSTVGGTCRIQWPQGEMEIRDEEEGMAAGCERDDGIVTFQTQPGRTYIITPV